MSGQTTPDKGAKMEEILRNYFLELGYFVVRGAKYKFGGCDITDIDLWLYQRTSIFNRQRFNVDIKSKRSPQAMERILWAKGLQDSLQLDGALVATTDSRTDVRQFGDKNKVVILDGSLLSKLKVRYSNNFKRISEEDFVAHLRDDRVGEDWWEKIELAKSKLLSQLDFDGCNSHLSDAKFFAEKILTVPHRKEIATRLFYFCVSLSYVAMDFIVREFAFLERQPQIAAFNNGLRYGMLGAEGAEKIFTNAAKIASLYTGNKVRPLELVKQLQSESLKLPVEILSEFLFRSPPTKSLFEYACVFENLAFAKTFEPANSLPTEQRGIISALLDFFQIERKKFFDVFVDSPASPNLPAANRQQDLLSSQNDSSTSDTFPVIHSADWWIEDKHSDVTSIVSSYLIDKKIQLECEVSKLGDPRPGISKLLTISYSSRGKKSEKTFKEHEIVTAANLK